MEAERGKALKIGHGFDSHRFGEGRELVLGGIRIPHDRGLVGHSDGDVLFHAAASALLGALGKGDLGEKFPSSDPKLKGIRSSEILRELSLLLKLEKFQLSNLDATVIAQEPRLGPFRERMERQLSESLEVSLEQVNVKITSTDGLGPIGRGEGIAAHAVVLLTEVEGL